ncbi:DUF2306 domain-containing protein [Nocardiopsis alba]|uniref:DUF2306 domain-containing protein n=1 Tax=Nocardiopsis alba TaxID=53437 RepID=UPI0035DA66CC
MTRTDLDNTEPTARAGGRRPRSHEAPRPWWGRPWVAPLAIAVVLSLGFILPPYLGLNPAQATVPIPEEFPFKYPVLVLHIATGSIAMVTCCLQVWPWLRENHPAVHRISGRLYVFAGVLPSVVLAWYLLTTFSGLGWVGRTVLSLLWFATTVVGFVRARQGRYAEHRRMMIYSFALTMEAFTTRVLFVGLMFALGIPLGENPEESAAFTLEAGETLAWCGWMINLVLATWWLNRDHRPTRSRGARRAGKGGAPVKEPIG